MLGHIVGAGSKRPDPSRTKTLMDFPIPENSSQLKRLLGFFRTTQSGLQTTQIRLLLCLQHRNNWLFHSIKLFGWLSQLLRKQVSSAVLWLPRVNDSLVLQTDASGTGIGATLTQGDKPVGFFSRTHSQTAKWHTQLLNGKLWLSWKASAVSQTCYVHHWFQFALTEVDSLALGTFGIQLRNKLPERLSERAS